ncbi:MAG: acetylxylan esterase [Euryarchaeota archaeon]|nr:acetylxylan esterase [Euryarchaeota archaeon]
MKRPPVTGLFILIIIVAMLLSGCISKPEWLVTDDGLLKYQKATPDYQLKTLEDSDNCTLYEVTYESRGADIKGLIRIPKNRSGKVPGIVLLPGATVSKEGEQGLARYLCDLGYASIVIDQRNLGGIDMEGDLRMFLNKEEPTQHKMVHDALSAAEVLRREAEIDPDRIVYLGESNGGRFAIIAYALDPDASGVVAISTCGYGIDTAVASGRIRDPDTIRFYRSIDPDTYLNKIRPRKFVMIHSLNDPIIPYDSAQQTYMKIGGPKSLYTIDAEGHGYCSEMDLFLKKELREMFS